MKQIFYSLLVVAGCVGGSGCQKQAATSQAGPPPSQVIALEAKPQPVSETLSLVGTLAAEEMVEIKAEADGVVEQINFEEGQPVEKGRLLLKLDESKHTATVAEAEANFKLSQANYERSRQLLKDKLISQQEYDQTASTFEVNRAGLELKKRLLKDTRIYAPFAGVMSARNVSPGQVIARNTALSWLVVLDPVKVEVNVPERFLSQLKIGQTLEIKVAAYADKPFKGEVYFIAPFVDPATRTALVKARIANADFRLKPGMFANLDLTLQIRQQALVIPEVALMMNGEDNAKAPDAARLFAQSALPAHSNWTPVPAATMPPDFPCDQCKGTGVYTETMGGETYIEDCEWCNHTGKVKLRIGVKVGGASFDQGYLSMIQGWEISLTGRKSAAWIRNGDTIGLLMPRNEL